MAEKKQKFEDKITELEAIINELENGNIPLEDSIEKYTKAMNMQYLDTNGQSNFPIMGCYGIGVGRLLACLCEEYNDEKGLCLPRCGALPPSVQSWPAPLGAWLGTAASAPAPRLRMLSSDSAALATYLHPTQPAPGLF